MSDYFTPVDIGGGQLLQAYFNLPAIVIMGLITIILVLGIRESATTNAVLVFVKTGVVIFVIILGIRYVKVENWTKVPVERRNFSDAKDYVDRHPDLKGRLPANAVTVTTTGDDLLKAHPEIGNGLNDVQKEDIRRLPNELKKWGLLGAFGIKDWLKPLDESCRSPFMPYGFSGLMAGAALVFFAYIGFDSISTHSEEALRPQRDVPLGILISLGMCTVLYILMAGVITGMEPYWKIDTGAAVASAFRKRAELDQSPLLRGSAWIIATGGAWPG